MSYEVMATCFWLGLIGGSVLVVFIISKVMDFISKRKDKKRHKEHPEFFRLYDEYNESGSTACYYHNKEIAPRKREIDYMLREEPYWPQEVREQKMEEIEKLRREIYTAEGTHKYMMGKTESARRKVADYVHAHNIKWAGDWN